ncbi:MAG: glutathione S-transferase [Alteromonadaceae bacterium]|nr:glutathione S-transferase [Alteromonadaceae bacterium]
MITDNKPILYSLKNCPYAIRARMALLSSKQQVILRNLVLTNKPKAFLITSPKGSVPVLALPSLTVLDESLQIMLWALNENDPDDLLHSYDVSQLTQMLALIKVFDQQFKPSLEQYKCAKRYHEDTVVEYRQACEQHLKRLENNLNQHVFFISDHASLADLAIFPYIRQFARVERQWYLQSPYPKLKQWLNNYLQSSLFTRTMTKYPLWVKGQPDVFFPD